MSKQIVNRSKAIEQGLKKYFTGIECGRGHLAERLTISGSCYECTRENNIKHREEIKNKQK